MGKKNIKGLVGLLWWSCGLKLHGPNIGGLGSIPGRGTRSHMQQLSVRMPQSKDPTCCSKDLRLSMPQPRPSTTKQINKY